MIKPRVFVICLSFFYHFFIVSKLRRFSFIIFLSFWEKLGNFSPKSAKTIKNDKTSSFCHFHFFENLFFENWEISAPNLPKRQNNDQTSSFCHVLSLFYHVVFSCFIVSNLHHFVTFLLSFFIIFGKVGKIHIQILWKNDISMILPMIIFK